MAPLNLWFAFSFDLFHTFSKSGQNKIDYFENVEWLIAFWMNDPGGELINRHFLW